ncbi:hypothetical protein [Citricoccus sp. K5]|uniref:hypothetical protein n=1 Tax=Citricoccus sp. K5 TaxID=2653135 RepID=UPI0012F19006|nr:hypothetical protein [Citricoccus sp. K5]VXB20639.1 conserved hypothetical protein [Citricoccus sp. K5]
MTEPVPGDVRPLLEQLGRAGTPSVNTTAYEVDLVAMAGFDRVVPSDDGETRDPLLVVGSRELLRRIRRHHPIVVAAPGMTAAQQESHGFLRTVIDAAAMLTGPWAGAESGPRRYLADELKALVLANHESRVTTYVIPDVPGLGRPEAVARLIDGATFIVTSTTADPDTEGSPRSQLLATMMDYANRGGQD